MKLMPWMTARRRWIGIATGYFAICLVATALLGAGRDAGIAGTVTAAPGGPSTYGDVTGLNYVGDMLVEPPAALERDLDVVAHTGVRYLRLAFDWSLVQRSGPASWEWSSLDRVIAAARRRGLSIVALPVATPSWASGTTASKMAPPRQAADWYTFVATAAARYLPQGVSQWEMWNEPNIPSGWYPAARPADYVAKVLDPGARAVRAAASAAHTTATVISAGLAPAVTYGANVAPIDFLEAVYASGGGRSFDAAGLHPYTTPAAPFEASPLGFGRYGTFLHAPDFHQVMVEHGDAAKKVWATEVGFPTGTCGLECVSPQTQSDMVPLVVRSWNALSFAGPLIWFQSRDSGTDPNVSLRHYGLVAYDFTPKPALATFTQVMATAVGALSPAVSEGSASATPSPRLTTPGARPRSSAHLGAGPRGPVPSVPPPTPLPAGSAGEQTAPGSSCPPLTSVSIPLLGATVDVPPLLSCTNP